MPPRPRRRMIRYSPNCSSARGNEVTAGAGPEPVFSNAALSRQAGQRPWGASVVSGVRHSRQMRTVSMFVLCLDFHRYRLQKIRQAKVTGFVWRVEGRAKGNKSEGRIPEIRKVRMEWHEAGAD